MNKEPRYVYSPENTLYWWMIMIVTLVVLVFFSDLSTLLEVLILTAMFLVASLVFPAKIKQEDYKTQNDIKKD